MDYHLLKITDAVDTVSAYIGARVLSSNNQLDVEAIRGDFDDEIRELFLSLVENLEWVDGCYVRFAPTFSSMIKDFAYRRKSNDTAFYAVSEEEFLSEFSNADKELNWYDIVEASREPSWIPIRECHYKGGYIISYAVPVYFGSELFGVACVDVDFELLAKPVREISLFGRGYAYLTDDKGRVCYHPLIGYGTLLTEDDEDVPEVDSALGDTSSHGKLIVYKYKGQKKMMAFQSLINDMRLVVTANAEDAEREATALVWRIILSAIGILIVILALSLFMEQMTMHPALDKMESEAHLDGLTGLQNKTAFMEMLANLNQKIREGSASFGFCMFDVNDLKSINDRYGHRRGDAYLLSVVEMLRESFTGCQMYRIGGDEFVVLVEGDSALQSADECLKHTYIWQTKRREEKRDPWEKPTVASAFARFDGNVHISAEEVLSKADELMYQRKQQMKEEQA